MSEFEGITYRDDFKAWWPDYDHSPEKCFQFVQHGLKDMDVAINQCKRHHFCVQAGGHAGFWPLRLEKRFGKVLTFEPEPKLFECMRRNVETMGSGRISMNQWALGATTGPVKMRPHVSAGSWRVEIDGTVEVNCTTIDILELNACDAIFLDIEGYEPQALAGAVKTIEKFRPVLHVEELPRAKDDIHAFMRFAKYKQFARAGRDTVYVPV